MSRNLHLGRAMQMLREQHGLTQVQLATRAGLGKEIIAYIERGAGNPTIDSLARIARGFGLEAWELLRLADRLRDTMDTRDEDAPRLTGPAWRAA